MTVPQVPVSSSPPDSQSFVGQRGRRLERRAKSTDCKPTSSLDVSQQLVPGAALKSISPTSPTSPSSGSQFHRRRPAPCEVARAPASRSLSSSATPKTSDRLSPVMQAAGRIMSQGGRGKHMNLAITCSDAVCQEFLLDSGNSSHSSSSGTPTPPPLSSLRRRSFRHGMVLSGEESERCSCCTKEDFWSLFDTFQDMDRDQSGVIGRRDFVWALRALGAGIEFHKAANKAKLSAHFHKSARDLPLEGFIRRAFPTCSDADVTRMLRWADLRRAHNLLLSEKFKATESELCQVFSFLDEDGSGSVALREVLRASIISREEAKIALPSQWGCSQLAFEDFCGLILRKYWDLDEVMPEEDAICQSPNASWRRAVRSKFMQTRDALVQELTTEEGSSLSWQPIVIPTPRGVKQPQLRSPSLGRSAVEASRQASKAECGAGEPAAHVPVPPAGSPTWRPRRSGPSACIGIKDSAEGRDRQGS